MGFEMYLGIGMAMALAGGTYFPRRRARKTMTVCSFPGCKKLTSHNGGYCSAVHCKRHQAIIKESKRKTLTKRHSD